MDRTPIAESHILSAGYDPATEKMHVEFKSGGLYEYSGVKPDEWHGFEATFDDPKVSTGKHFHAVFRAAGKPSRRLQ